MPKSRARAPRPAHPAPQPPAPATMAVPLGYNPKGKIEQRDVVSSKGGWSEYTLDDGSIIRAKAVVLDVKKAIDQYDIHGEPIYIVQMAVVNNAIVPENLKKKD